METLNLTAEQRVLVKPVHLVFLFVVCFISTAFGGVISTLMSVYLPVVVKDLQGDQTTQQLNDISGYINAMFIFGWAVGGFLWGMVSDKIGRKNSLLLAIASYGVFTMLTGFNQTWGGVVFCRFMSGFGVGGVLVITVTLLSEVWPEKSRAIYIGIVSIAFPVGIFSAGAINYFVSSWRSGFLIGAIPLALAIIGYWMIRESDVWISNKAQHLIKPKSSNKLFSPSNRKALLIGSVVFGTMLVGLWGIFAWMPTWIQSLFTVDAPKERGLSMMVLGMGGLTGGFFSGWLVNIMGLRKSLIASFAVCTVAACLLFKTNTTFSPLIYVEIAFLALFFGASQGILSVYIPLLFPTGVRASATGFCFNAGRIFTAIAVLFIGVLVTKLGGYGNSLFIFSLVFVPGLLVVLLAKDIQPSTHVQELIEEELIN